MMPITMDIGNKLQRAIALLRIEENVSEGEEVPKAFLDYITLVMGKEAADYLLENGPVAFKLKYK